MKKKENNKLKDQITVNQHYVPRFYMKPFSTVINEGTDKEKAFISFFQFKNEICKDNIPTTSICSEDYFYDKDGHIEDELANKEKIWANIIMKINQDEWITESEICNMREFVIYQITRTKAMLEHTQEMATTILTDSLSNAHSELDKNIIHDMVENKVKDEITPEYNLTIVNKLNSIIDDMDMIVIDNKTNIPFITSDVPIIIINPLGIYRAGLGDIGEVIFFPISESKLVMFYDSRFYGKIHRQIFDEETIHIFNKYQYISADERILSRENDIFAYYTSNKELNNTREKSNDVSKTNTLFDGIGTFIAAKSRSIEYYYDIPIFKLPKQLRKIPREFRETFPRNYSYETRRAILCRVYRKPDFTRNENEAKYWKKNQEYSKILLNYLDYYWKTPREDCQISGEYMHLLQTVPISKIKAKK